MKERINDAMTGGAGVEAINAAIEGSRSHAIVACALAVGSIALSIWREHGNPDNR